MCMHLGLFLIMPLPKLYQLFCWHYSIKGDNPDKKLWVSYFLMRNASMKILKPYLKLVMDGRTDGKAQSNMPLNFFAQLSQRLMGELIVYQSLCRPSVRRRSVNIFQTSSPLKPLGHLNYISYEDS